MFKRIVSALAVAAVVATSSSFVFATTSEKSITDAYATDSEAAAALVALEKALEELVPLTDASKEDSVAEGSSEQASGAQSTATNAPKTGDSNPIAAGAAVALLALSGGVLVLRKRRASK